LAPGWGQNGAYVKSAKKGEDSPRRLIGTCQSTLWQTKATWLGQERGRRRFASLADPNASFDKKEEDTKIRSQGRVARALYRKLNTGGNGVARYGGPSKRGKDDKNKKKKLLKSLLKGKEGEE